MTVDPGNSSDAHALLPVVERARERFGLNKVCFVADRGMVSSSVIAELEARGIEYILGVRMRRVREVREKVLSHPGRYQKVEENLYVKEVKVDGRRYIVCYNPEQAKKDAQDRTLILEGLEKRLNQGAKALVGNRGYRRYLITERDAVMIDYAKVQEEARYDGKWVLRTNTTLSAAEVALQYKHLLTVERSSGRRSRFWRRGRSSTGRISRSPDICSRVSSRYSSCTSLRSGCTNADGSLNGRISYATCWSWRKWRCAIKESGTCCGRHSREYAARCCKEQGWRSRRRCGR